MDSSLVSQKEVQNQLECVLLKKNPVKNANNQLWFLDDAGEGYYYIVSKLKPDDTLVLDIEGRSTENDARVKTYHRKPDHKPRQDRANQMWRVDPDGTIVSALHGKVMDVKGRNTAPGTPIVMFGKKAAHDHPQNQQWRLDQPSEQDILELYTIFAFLGLFFADLLIINITYCIIIMTLIIDNYIM